MRYREVTLCIPRPLWDRLAALVPPGTGPHEQLVLWLGVVATLAEKELAMKEAETRLVKLPEEVQS